MSKLLRAERGAAMVFGIFFAVFFIAAVWSLWGTIETVLYRQRVQDAADAAAFSAAVVNARGMNLIALINMTMAAVLAILVGLRLAQTLGYIAIFICSALSSVTMGATGLAVPPLQGVVKGIATAADKVKDPIEQLLKVLHQVGAVTAKVVPLGANVRVIDLVASHHDAFGVAIPSRMTLPVEDDDFSVLCAHAGKVAGTLAIKPLSPLLPSQAEDAFGDAMSKLAKAGSAWFCGGGGSPPDLNDDERTRWVELPRFASQDECDAKTKAEIDPDESEESYRAPCERAGTEMMASMPNRSGGCREGQPICPTNCEGTARESCPPDGFTNCQPDRSAELSSQATSLLGSATVSCADDSPYSERLALAREQCLPEGEGGRKGLGGYAWTQRRVMREYYWSETAGSWLEDTAKRSEEATQQVRRKNRETLYPCGQGGSIGLLYERDASRPLCESVAECEAAQPFQGARNTSGPCSRARPRHKDDRFREHSVEVLNLLRCAYASPAEQVKTPPMDVSKEFSNSGGDTSPFRLEKGMMLGASDFQLRSVVMGKQLPSAAQRVVAMAWWGGPRGEEVSSAGGAFVSLASGLGRIGLAQAEYYFDWTGLGDDAPKNQKKPADITEWMWNMAWRARLRPFRLDHDTADPEEGGSGGKGPQAGGKGGGGAQALDCKSLPKGAGGFCGDAQEALKLFGGGKQ
jgi:hypothetical protein